MTRCLSLALYLYINEVVLVSMALWNVSSMVAADPVMSAALMELRRGTAAHTTVQDKGKNQRQVAFFLPLR